jgi:biotin carboxylase
LIRKAIDRGIVVISLDNRPHNPGHALAHEWVDCSTRDCDRVLEYARLLRIDGIATMASDVGLPTLGHVAERLQLPGCPSSVARCVTNKAAFRAFQHATPGLSAPRFVSGEAFSELFPRVCARLTPPLLFKPVDSSGSRGITRVNALTERRCRAAFEAARQFSASGTVCVESHVHGRDASGDGFVIGGRLAATVTHKYSTGFVPLGHGLPSRFDERDLERICVEVERTCAALGYRDGPIDFDVRVAADQVTVVELSARLGGNGIPALVERTKGIDLVALNVAHALGDEVRLEGARGTSASAGSFIFGSRYQGRLCSVAAEAEIRTAVPEVFEYRLHRQVGESVVPFEHSGNSIGHVLFDLDTPAAYESTVARITRALAMVIETRLERHAEAIGNAYAATATF